jgi:ribosomal-protein-serine acetyltransferase
MIGFHRIDWSNRTASLGYWLGEAWQGEGRMKRVASTI